MTEFDLADRDVRAILQAVHWMQTVWMIAVGLALFFAPARRFGSSYQFIVATPCLQQILAILYFVSGLVMMLSLVHHWPKPMGRAMRLGGLINWGFGMLLLLGALNGPTGVLGPLFTMYVGAHMLIQSVLLKRAM